MTTQTQQQHRAHYFPRTSTIISKWLVLVLTVVRQWRFCLASSVLSCSNTTECQELWGPTSVCTTTDSVTPYCTNPYRHGCLAALSNYTGLSSWRVCNSDDDDTTSEHCRPPPISYMEARIYAGNWESSVMEAWLLQIALSELLGVPTTIESGSLQGKLSLYEPGANDFVYGTGRDKDALVNGYWRGDCRLARRIDDGEDAYEPCAHISPESWEIYSVIPWVQQLVYNGTLEQRGTLGVLGEEAWFVTKFTAQEDPSLTSYLGLQGDHQRQKLADLFLRPTTWKDYCAQVSLDNCQTPNSVAQRAPETPEEETRMFVEGLYTGHFRKTAENDCDQYPHNCTGHIGDYPCGWTSYLESQTFHLNIPLRSSGSEPNSRGYTSQQLADMWRAANATRSHLLMYWWRPESLYQEFAGSDAEFQRVLLPPPSQQCARARLTPRERCAAEEAERVGSPDAACDESPIQLEKLMSTGLYRSTYDENIPDAIRNPAYEVLKAFRLNELQLGELFEYRREKKSMREAVCVWAGENIEHIKTFLPPTYPRKLQVQEFVGVATASLIMASLALLSVLLVAILVFLSRHKRSIQVAQIEFLWLLLTGLFLVVAGAIVQAVGASSVTCLLVPWLVNLGYTMELIPLIVKVAAINRLNSAARKFRRVTLTRKSLFRAVGGISLIVVVYLMLWTTLDPPDREAEYSLTRQRTEMNETVVNVRYYCNSFASAWKYGALAWHVLMLVSATVLAFQTRRVQKLFNECHTLAVMIYSHGVFVILRSICCLLAGYVSYGVVRLLLSLIFSTDAILTLLIYFCPKLFLDKDNEPDHRVSWVEQAGATIPTMPDRRASWVPQVRSSMPSAIPDRRASWAPQVRASMPTIPRHGREVKFSPECIPEDVECSDRSKPFRTPDTVEASPQHNSSEEKEEELSSTEPSRSSSESQSSYKLEVTSLWI